MRRIAIINQKGGVGKTTTAANLGAALARAGRRVLVVDMDPQANLSLYLGSEPRTGANTVYKVLTEGLEVERAIIPTRTEGLQLLPAHIDLSGAELELASTIGRETILRDALDAWVRRAELDLGFEPADYVLLDCPPSLGLLSVNALTAANEVFVVVQTEFFALQGLGKLVEVIQLLRRRLNPALNLSGLVPCLYDSRLRLAREVLGELRRFFPDKVFESSIASNVKVAESPSHSQTIFEYAPDSKGAKDYAALAIEVLAQEQPGQLPSPGLPGRDSEDAVLGVTAAALRENESGGSRPATEPVPPAPEPIPSSPGVSDEPVVAIEPAQPSPSQPSPAQIEAVAQGGRAGREAFAISVSAEWDEDGERPEAEPEEEQAEATAPALEEPVAEEPVAEESEPTLEVKIIPLQDAATYEEQTAAAQARPRGFVLAPDLVEALPDPAPFGAGVLIPGPAGGPEAQPEPAAHDEPDARLEPTLETSGVPDSPVLGQTAGHATTEPSAVAVETLPAAETSPVEPEPRPQAESPEAELESEASAPEIDPEPEAPEPETPRPAPLPKLHFGHYIGEDHAVMPGRKRPRR